MTTTVEELSEQQLRDLLGARSRWELKRLNEAARQLRDAQRLASELAGAPTLEALAQKTEELTTAVNTLAEMDGRITREELIQRLRE